MKLSGSAVSAIVHGVALAVVIFLVKTDTRLPTPIMAWINSDPPAKVEEAVKPPEPKKAPEPEAAKPKSKPKRAAPAPTTAAAAAQAAAQAQPAAAPVMDLGLVLEGDEGGVPAGAVVLPAGYAGTGPGGPARPVAGGRPAQAAIQRPEPAKRRCLEELVPPEPVSRTQFEYPPGAPGVEGRLVAHIHVGEDGYVQRVDIERAVDHAVDRAAIECFKRWRFKPALRCGAPSAGVFKIALNFELSE